MWRFVAVCGATYDGRHELSRNRTRLRREYARDDLMLTESRDGLRRYCDLDIRSCVLYPLMISLSIFPYWTWLYHRSFREDMSMRHQDEFFEYRRNILGFIQDVKLASSPKPMNSRIPPSRSSSTAEKDLREHSDFVLKRRCYGETMKTKDTYRDSPRLGSIGDNAGFVGKKHARPDQAARCVSRLLSMSASVTH